jgi:hypothetical protein
MLLKEIQGIYEGKGVVLDRPEHYEMIPTVVFARVSGADGTEKGAGYALFQYPTSSLAGDRLVAKIGNGAFVGLVLREWKSEARYFIEREQEWISVRETSG